MEEEEVDTTTIHITTITGIMIMTIIIITIPLPIILIDLLMVIILIVLLVVFTVVVSDHQVVEVDTIQEGDIGVALLQQKLKLKILLPQKNHKPKNNHKL